MKSPLRAHAALVSVVVIWGVNFSVAKIALTHVSPLAFNALRYPMAALLLFFLLRARGPVPLPTRADMPRVLLAGLLGNLIYQLCFIFGLDHTRAGNASLLLAGTPIVTALLSVAVGHERLQGRTWLGVLGTFGGIVLIVLGAAQETATGAHSIIGDALMLGASITWACYTVLSRPLVDRYGSIALTAWTLWIGTIGLMLAGAHDVLALDFARISLATWAAIAYAGLLSIGLSYTFWYYGVAQLGNTRTSSYSNATPVVALLTAWLALGEVPKLAQIVGAIVIITGVTIAQSGRPTRAEDVSPEV